MSDVESNPPVEEDERNVALEASKAMLELLLERPLYATASGDKEFNRSSRERLT